MATSHTAQAHQAPVARAPMGLMVLAAVAVVVPAVLLTGAVAAPVAGLADPGVLVRWGLPVVRAIHDVAAAMTVGLLVLAATIIPETTATNRRVTATRWASASAVVWVVAALAGLVLSFADISTTPLDRPGVRHAVPVVRACRSRSCASPRSAWAWRSSSRSARRWPAPRARWSRSRR